jgi:uncharacterized protein
MQTKIFVNLPVKDLNRSIEFFKQLGYTFNPQFTDEKATCMIISEENYVMLVTEPFFRTFTKKQISDASTTTEVIISLTADSREAVDEMIGKAVAAGAKTPNDPQDYGWMYQHGYEDPDGHLWEVFYMDMAEFERVNSVQNSAPQV